MKGPSKSTGVGGSLSLQSGREGRRKTMGRAVDELRPDIPHREDAAPAIEGDVAYCKSCHAIYHPKHWHLDEREYQKLSQNPSVTALVCESCRAIERGDFWGEARLMLEGLERYREQILNTVYNEEGRAREKNPHERIGKLVEEGNTITINTVSPFLAHRIGVVLKKAIHGTTFQSDYLPGQEYARLRWGKREVVD